MRSRWSRWSRRAWLVVLLVVVSTACGRAAGGNAAKAVTFAILEDYDKGDDLAEVARDFALFHELGITTWRGSLGWDDFEPEPGRFDFDWLHRFAALAAQHGITLRPYVAYTPAWAAAGGQDGDAWNDPPRRLDEWTRFVRALAGALARHPNVRSLEIYNEENVPQWWDGSGAAYDAVFTAAAAAIREVHPLLEVIFGGMVFPDREWIERACRDGGARGRFSILPFHAYPETWTPPGVDVERYLGPGFQQDFVAPAHEACGPVRIWINETGFATTAGRSEDEQAHWWLRAIATFLAVPRVEHLGVYEIKDLPPGREAIGGTPNYHLGITRADRTPKRAFRTLRRAVDLMTRAPVTPVVSITAPPPDPAGALPGEDLYVRIFSRPDGSQVVFAWAKRTRQVTDLVLPAPAGRVTEFTIDGEPRPFTDVAGNRLRSVQLEPGAVRWFDIAPGR